MNKTETNKLNNIEFIIQQIDTIAQDKRLPTDLAMACVYLADMLRDTPLFDCQEVLKVYNND